MWCTASRSRCSRGPSRSSSARRRGPAPRSNRAACAAASRRETSAAAAPVRSRTGSGTRVAAPMTWYNAPSHSVNVVRNASCRATTLLSAAPSASVSRGPRSDTGSGTVYAEAPCSSSATIHSPACAYEAGTSGPAGCRRGMPGRPDRLSSSAFSSRARSGDRAGDPGAGIIATCSPWTRHISRDRRRGRLARGYAARRREMSRTSASRASAFRAFPPASSGAPSNRSRATARVRSRRHTPRTSPSTTTVGLI